MHTLNETVELITNLGVKKVHKTLKEQLVLSFIAGAMISFGYMAYVKSVALLGSSVGVLVGAAIFPIGLIVILVAGGELITGNMMVVGTAYWSGKVKGLEVLKNWLVITCGNILGALCVAILFSAFLESVPKDLMLDSVHHKLNASPLQLIVSGIGCNWFVGLAVWLFVALKDLRDGHDFVALALEKGAAAALVTYIPDGVAADAPLLCSSIQSNVEPSAAV